MTWVQRRGLAALHTGRDLFAHAPLGEGKSTLACIAALRRVVPTSPGTQALLLAPSRELCSQLAATVERLAAAMPHPRMRQAGGEVPAPRRRAAGVAAGGTLAERAEDARRLAGRPAVAVTTAAAAAAACADGTLPLEELRAWVLTTRMTCCGSLELRRARRRCAKGHGKHRRLCSPAL